MFRLAWYGIRVVPFYPLFRLASEDIKEKGESTAEH